MARRLANSCRPARSDDSRRFRRRFGVSVAGRRRGRERTKAALQAENIALMQERRELERLVHEMRAEIDAAGYDVLDDDEGGTDALAPAAA